MALVVTKLPGQAAEVQDVEDLSLRFLQSCVGGSIELVRLSREWAMWVNEEGLLKGLEPNMLMPTQIIVGPVVVTSLSGGKTVGLQPEDVEEVRITLDAMAEAYDILKSRGEL